MHISCSNTMPALPPMGCDGNPLATDTTPATAAQQALNNAARIKFEAFSQQFDALLAKVTPQQLAQPGTYLVCDTDEEAGYMRLLLDRRGLTHIEARVKLKLPARKRARQNRQARQRAGYKARR